MIVFGRVKLIPYFMACLLHCFYNLTKCDRQNPTAFLKSEFKNTSNEKRGKLCENKS